MHAARGILVLTLMAMSTVVCSLLIFALAPLRVLSRGSARRTVDGWLAGAIDLWVSGNVVLIRVLDLTRIRVEGDPRLDRNGWYLIISNHQSWADIIVLQTVFRSRAPALRFFTKQQLIWIPFLGLAMWVLGFPFMRRHTAAEIARNPALRGRDMATTRAACERFVGVPTSILNFAEGTRCTPAKQRATGSPWRHLLAPRIGGLAFVLGAVREQIDQIVDVTLVYPHGIPSFWDLVCGRCPEVTCHIEAAPPPVEFASGDYATDPAFRDQFRAWLEQRWAAKDARIEAALRAVAAQQRTHAAVER